MLRLCGSLVLGALVASAAPRVYAQTPAPKFQLAASTLQLAPGATRADFVITVLARLAKEDLRPGAKAILTDRTPSATGVSVTSTPVETTSDLEQQWHFPVRVDRFPPADSQSRVFIVEYGSVREALTYTLANTSKTFAWSVKTSADWNLSSMATLSIALRVGDVAATGVRLHHAALAGDDKLKLTLGTEHFQLCENAKDSCDRPITIEPSKPRPVFLRPRGALPVGTFKGNVFITAEQKTDPEVLPLTIYSPHPNGVPLGIAALALGVLVALVLQVLARSWLQSRQDKAAIALLQARLDDVVKDFDGLPDATKTAAGGWKLKADALEQEIAKLRRLVRSVIPQPFAGEVASVEELKGDLERLGKTVVYLRTLGQGLKEVARIVAGSTVDVTEEARKAAKNIAAIGEVADLATPIANALAPLRAAADAPQVARMAAASRAAERLQSLRLQIGAASLVVWFVWGAISVLTGALVLIYQNPAFGTDVDLLTCLAWGLGVSMAGQQAAQQTPGTVAQSIGVRLPGAK